VTPITIFNGGKGEEVPRGTGGGCQNNTPGGKESSTFDQGTKRQRQKKKLAHSGKENSRGWSGAQWAKVRSEAKGRGPDYREGLQKEKTCVGTLREKKRGKGASKSGITGAKTSERRDCQINKLKSPLNSQKKKRKLKTQNEEKKKHLREHQQKITGRVRRQGGGKKTRTCEKSTSEGHDQGSKTTGGRSLGSTIEKGQGQYSTTRKRNTKLLRVIERRKASSY